MKEIHKYEINIIMDALDIAKKSDMRAKHGCIIIDNKGNTISKACNKSKLTKFEFYDKYNKMSAHAEECALNQVNPKKLYGARLYVVRYGYNEGCPLIMNSKPCKRCQIIIEKYMNKFGLKCAYYSSDFLSNNITCQII